MKNIPNFYQDQGADQLRSAVNVLPEFIRNLLTDISTKKSFSESSVIEVFSALPEINPPIRDVILGTIMTAVMMLGPRTGDIIALIGAALALDSNIRLQKIACHGHKVVAIAGSGKKGKRTLNISTPAALVAAAAGAKVVKIGSGATSSSLGSRDLVGVLGLPEHLNPSTIEISLQLHGFAFVAIEPMIPIVDNLYGGKFYSTNPFSFGLAPLVSPVRGDVTLFGLSHPSVGVAAAVLSTFGIADADVISTHLAPEEIYVDELIPGCHMLRCQVRDNHITPTVNSLLEDAALIGFSPGVPAAQSPDASVESVLSLLEGNGFGAYHNAVAANAAYILVLAGVCGSMKEATAVASDVLSSGLALRALNRIRSGGVLVE